MIGFFVLSLPIFIILPIPAKSEIGVVWDGGHIAIDQARVQPVLYQREIVRPMNGD
jgi:hypothetical protein